LLQTLRRLDPFEAASGLFRLGFIIGRLDEGSELADRDFVDPHQERLANGHAPDRTLATNICFQPIIQAW
jgi:hypothetical protein